MASIKTTIRAPFVAAVLLVLWLAPLASAQVALPRDVRARIIAAVVEIVPLDEAGEPVGIAGSGTIVSPDGDILTNFHVIGDLDTRRVYPDYAVFMTRPGFYDQPPEPLYLASYVASDPAFDLAILRIDRNIDGSAVVPSTTFTSIPVGSTSDTMPGDLITIIGYPGVSGLTITFTAGLLSGWVGEDFEAGGKQWIKTDAKIAHGNSGGAAVNDRGELIGVPTAGRTIEYEELDVEEQAYVRPIGLAWSLIGPHVANVTRVEPERYAPPLVTTERPDTPAGSGHYGEVELDTTRRGVIAGTPEGNVFHTYTVSVPPGLDSLVVTVDGGGKDIDLAVKAGAEILSYQPPEDGGDSDYIDTSVETTASYTYLDPPSGVVYIDVISLLDEPIAYELSVTTGPSAGEFRANFSDSRIVGGLRLGQSSSGTLADPDLPRYHTYYVDVPAGTSQITISMTADVDLDLAVRLGAEITSLADKSDGGDWDYRDESAEPRAEFVIASPQPGRWFIDVFTRYEFTGSYRLSVR